MEMTIILHSSLEKQQTANIIFLFYAFFSGKEEKSIMKSNFYYLTNFLFKL